ncbi:lectin-like [Benincasa hispida]|uniref:lectin-like n=1 Tax=Benincasa hispida TaxID=102211 RepID=UPI001902658F|nr:lectin-like [Benincasa hispida]
MDPEELEARKYLGVKLSYGHNLDCIFSHSDDKLQNPTFVPLFDQLLDGVSFNQGTRKFRLNQPTNSNRVFILPKALSIAWVNDTRYWKWIIVTDNRNEVEAPQLIQVSWFDIHGSVKASWLSSRVVYLVAFLVMLTEDASGWNHHVNLTIKKPNGCTVETKVSLEGKPKGEFFEVWAGDFILDNCGCGDSGVVEFGMYEHGGHWKRGLIVKGVVIRSKASAGCPHETLSLVQGLNWLRPCNLGQRPQPAVHLLPQSKASAGCPQANV